MKLDKRLHLHSLGLLFIAVLVALPERLHVPLYQDMTVYWVETGQSIWLLFGALFTFIYAKITPMPREKKIFWLWSVTWWVMLFGRGISWGRDYAPEQPKIYFHLISYLLIGIVIVTFLVRPELHREVFRRLKSETLPLWDCLIMVVCFIIADTIEHHRYFAFLFLQDHSYQDLMEEMFEVPFMLALFSVAFYLMKKDAIQQPPQAGRIH
nr:hypothetical protein [Pantoea sp. 201603H]